MHVPDLYDKKGMVMSSSGHHFTLKSLTFQGVSGKIATQTLHLVVWLR